MFMPSHYLATSRSDDKNLFTYKFSIKFIILYKILTLGTCNFNCLIVLYECEPW